MTVRSMTAAAVFGLFVATSIAATSNPNDFADPPSELRAYIERYTTDRGTLSRFYSIELSRSRYDRMHQFYSEWLDRLGSLSFDSMGGDGKVDYVLFRNHLQHELRELELESQRQKQAERLVPFASAIVRLEESRRRMDPVDPKAAASSLNTLVRDVLELERTIKSDSKPAYGKSVANRAASETGSLRAILKRWFDFYNAYDPLFIWWAAESYRRADSALQSYAAVLRQRVVGVRDGEDGLGSNRGRRLPLNEAEENVASPDVQGRTAQSAQRMSARMDNADDIVGDPIGREGLMSELANELIPYTPEELIAIANKELAWCEDQMRRASRELGYGNDWKKALEHVKNMHVEPGKQPQLIRELAREAETFLEQHDLITIPSLARETWRMEMMSPERQLVNPFFTGGEVISVSYPVESMTFEQKLMSMRGNNIPFSRATVFHELIPGHELQGFMGARYRSYRNVFNTPFAVEGWALYWELLLWDMKFQKTPEDRIGALFWRMHRCARIIFSLSFHLGAMTPQQCVDLLVDRVGHERSNAIGEVRRSFAGNYSPLYQAAYLLGGMQLYALHKELIGSGKMTNRQFHDRVLREGRISIEMLRAALTQQKLDRNYTSTWKFYGPVTP